MQGIYEYFPQERVIFGEDHRVVLRREMARAGARRVYVMTSATLSRTTGVITDLRDRLGEACVGVFDQMPGHSPRQAILRAIAEAEAVQPDLILAIGGGSSIDAAKVVRIGLSEGIRSTADFDRYHLRKDAEGATVNPGFRPSSILSIAVPTTLSGAEYTHTAGSVDEAGQKKDLYVQADLVPRVVILDPALSLHTPDWLWFSTAIRAVDHAVESLCSPTANPFTDATCLQGLTMMARAIRQSKKDPADLAARLEALMAVWLSTSGMARGQHGASHGISYSLAAVAGVAHGHCSCVLLPAVLRWNRQVTAAAQDRIAAALGAPGGDAARALLDLLAELGLPQRLGDLGVDARLIPQIARTVIASGQARFNPRPLTGAEEVAEILETAL